MPSLLKTSLLLNLLLSSLRQAQESQSFGLVGSCGNYIEAGIKFFLFFCPYNIFFFFWAVLVFVAARRLSAGVVHKLLTEGASLVEHRLQSVRA